MHCGVLCVVLEGGLGDESVGLRWGGNETEWSRDGAKRRVCMVTLFVEWGLGVEGGRETECGGAGWVRYWEGG